jgi:hypothetical protein
MILVEDLFRSVEVGLDLRLLAPRNARQPVEIVAHDGGFRRHRAHLAQLLQFGIRLLAGLLGELDLGDLLFEFGHLVAAVLAVAKFLLDRLHLFVEVVLALGLLHLALDARADALFDLQDGNLAFHEAERLFEAQLDASRLEHFLLLDDLDGEVRGDRVGELRVVLDLARSADDLGRNLLVELDVVLELGDHRARQRLDLDRVLFRLGQHMGHRLVEFLTLRIAVDLGARAAFDQHLDGAVGQLQQLENVGDGADAIDGVGFRIVVGSVDLGGKHDLLVGAHHLFQRADRLLATDEQRHDHVREHHDVAQGQDREGRGVVRRRRLLRHVISFQTSRFREPVQSALGDTGPAIFSIHKWRSVNAFSSPTTECPTPCRTRRTNGRKSSLPRCRGTCGLPPAMPPELTRNRIEVCHIRPPRAVSQRLI